MGEVRVEREGMVVGTETGDQAEGGKLQVGFQLVSQLGLPWQQQAPMEW